MGNTVENAHTHIGTSLESARPHTPPAELNRLNTKAAMDGRDHARDDAL